MNANQGSKRCQFFSLWLDPTGDSNTDIPYRTLYTHGHRPEGADK